MCLEMIGMQNYRLNEYSGKLDEPWNGCVYSKSKLSRARGPNKAFPRPILICLSETSAMCFSFMITNTLGSVASDWFMTDLDSHHLRMGRLLLLQYGLRAFDCSICTVLNIPLQLDSMMFLRRFYKLMQKGIFSFIHRPDVLIFQAKFINVSRIYMEEKLLLEFST